MLDLLIMGHIQAPKGIDDFGHFQNLTCALDSQELSETIQLEKILSLGISRLVLGLVYLKLFVSNINLNNYIANHGTAFVKNAIKISWL
jgi:hypothetical protein